ncbi:MAG TPA: DUF4407 domain-containing protein [Edaphocola sp.]|jgi:hypothetical protein|nr:DUF4407 domain-containing protein [Edaphocola sp.]
MSYLLKAIRDRLCKFSGEDYTIIQKCGNKVQFYFSLIGLLVLVILLCSFASALYFTEHLFHSIIVDIGVGIVWGYIITNMYLLLLYTISPTLLPTKIRKKQEVKTNQFQLSFSMGLRIFIVILLAVIIAQPLNVLILKPNSTTLAFDIKDLLSSNPLATIITLAVVAVFLLPVYLKYNIRKLGEFYEKKAEVKKKIIKDDYEDFKKEYRQILESNISNYNKSVWGNLMPFLNKLEKVNPISYQKYFAEIEKELKTEKIEKYEYWENPPYRTIHKSRTKNTLSEQDLLNHIYPKTD